MKMKEMEFNRILSERLNEAKLSALEEKLINMDEKNELKRQIDQEKFKGDNAVLAAKLQAEKDARKADMDKPPTIVNPYGSMPPWWNPSWGVWNPFTGFPFPANSVLLNPHFFQVIQTWLGVPRNWVLLYRGTRDGFGAAQFHALCNNVVPTVSIVRSTSNYLFGGYNPNNWNSSNNYQPGSFIFTLTNAWSSPPTIFHWNKNHGPSANNPFGATNFGPTFGQGYDLRVCDNCNSNTNSFSNFPSSYTDTLGHRNATFAGTHKFQVADIEVFRLC